MEEKIKTKIKAAVLTVGAVALLAGFIVTPVMVAKSKDKKIERLEANPKIITKVVKDEKTISYLKEELRKYSRLVDGIPNLAKKISDDYEKKIKYFLSLNSGVAAIVENPKYVDVVDSQNEWWDQFKKVKSYPPSDELEHFKKWMKQEKRKVPDTFVKDKKVDKDLWVADDDKKPDPKSHNEWYEFAIKWTLLGSLFQEKNVK